MPRWKGGCQRVAGFGMTIARLSTASYGGCTRVPERNGKWQSGYGLHYFWRKDDTLNRILERLRSRWRIIPLWFAYGANQARKLGNIVTIVWMQVWLWTLGSVLM